MLAGEVAAAQASHGIVAVDLEITKILFLKLICVTTLFQMAIYALFFQKQLLFFHLVCQLKNEFNFYLDVGVGLLDELLELLGTAHHQELAQRKQSWKNVR